MARSRGKLFIENFFIYGMINAINKIVPLLILPILTRLLSDTSEFGRFDMFNTIVSLGSSLAILGMYDAMFREYFEKEEKSFRIKVTSTALAIVIGAAITVGFFIIVFRESFSIIFFNEKTNGYIVVAAAFGVLIAAINSIVSGPTRIQNRRKLYVVSNLLNSLTYYALAIALVFWGYGYLGMIFAYLFATLLMVVFFLIINRGFFKFEQIDKSVGKELLKIGIPLVPTFIIYWVFSSVDKIMIANMLDLAQVGIYSIGLRVASVSNFIYLAFAGGWQFFAFSTMKDKDQVKLNSKVFEYLGAISFLFFCVAINLDDVVFKVLFTGDYVLGASVFPYLFLSPLLLMLFQTVSNQFLVIKRSYYISLSLLLGSLLNVVLNFFFIQSIGIKGAALATLMGYIISLILVMLLAIRHKLLDVSKRFLLISSLTSFIIFALVFEINITLFLSIFTVLIILVLYRKDVTNLKLQSVELEKKE